MARPRTCSFLFIGLLLAICALTVYRFWPHQTLPAGSRADKILVLKGKRELQLLKDGEIVRRYRIALGHTPRGAKVRQGDGRTPEGIYRIDWRNPRSRFHLSLHISYPSAADRQWARRLGVPPGGDIMIHGIANGFGWIGRLHSLIDWTSGCVAVTDDEIEEIWKAAPNGTPIEIRP